MCGIAGVIDRSGVAAPTLRGLARDLAHRGPDDEGYLEWDGTAPLRATRSPVGGAPVALVHRRLSILDVSSAAAQPMVDPTGRLALVFNGEVYDYRELRGRVRSPMVDSSGDTAVVLGALCDGGASALSSFEGMFALAWLDTEAKALHLARDPFGIKPLFWTSWSGGFAFASELPALLAAAPVRRRADGATVADYLEHGLCDHTDRTFVAGVHHLPAGHVLTVSLDTLELSGPRPYLHLEPRAGSSAGDVGSELVRSVGLHLRSDVPVGALLSGGIDSSAIVCAMRRVGGPELDLRTFSYIAGEGAPDESRWMGIVNDRVSARATLIELDELDVGERLDRLVLQQGEPFGSTSIAAQNRLFEAVARDVKVVLDGQGADELFAGYRPFVVARAAGLLRRGRVVAAGRVLRGATASLPPLVAGATVARSLAGTLPAGLHSHLRSARLRRSPGLDRAWLEANLAPGTAGVDDPGDLHGVLRHAVASSSLPALLRYEDRSSMAYSVESRVPFLTVRIAELAMGLADDALVDEEGRGKAGLRAGLTGLVPQEVLDRRDKVGFETPELRWLRGRRPWVLEALTSDAARAIPALDVPAAAAHAEAVLDGRARFDWRVWRWINLVRWTELLEVEHR